MLKFLAKNKAQILFFLIGVTVGFTITLFPLSFVHDIDPLNMINILVTLLVALIVGLYLEPKNQDSRVEKDILISQLNEIKLLLREIQAGFQDVYDENPISEGFKSKLRKQLRSVSNLLYSFDETYNECGFSYTKPTLTPAFINYKRTLTGNGFDNPSFKYDKAEGYYNASYLRLLREINSSIIKINKNT